MGLLNAHLRAWAPRESDALAPSRVVLQRFCHDTFERENQALVRALDWPTRWFVPPVEGSPDGNDPGDINELDRLWTPEASAAERELLYVALRDLLAGDLSKSRALGKLRSARRRLEASATDVARAVRERGARRSTGGR